MKYKHKITGPVFCSKKGLPTKALVLFGICFFVFGICLFSPCPCLQYNKNHWLALLFLLIVLFQWGCISTNKHRCCNSPWWNIRKSISNCKVRCTLLPHCWVWGNYAPGMNFRIPEPQVITTLITNSKGNDPGRLGLLQSYNYACWWKIHSDHKTFSCFKEILGKVSECLYHRIYILF